MSSIFPQFPTLNIGTAGYMIPTVYPDVRTYAENESRHTDAVNQMVVQLNQLMAALPDYIDGIIEAKYREEFDSLNTKMSALDRSMITLSEVVDRQIEEFRTEVQKAVTDIQSDAIVVSDPVMVGVLNDPESGSAALIRSWIDG